MAWSLLSSVTIAGNGAITSSAIDTTGATLLVISISPYSTPRPTSVTDSKGNIWSLINVIPLVGGSPVWLAVCFPTSVGTGHTFTVNAAYCASIVAAFSGPACGIDSKCSANSNAGANVESTAITPSADGALVLSGLSQDGGSAHTIDAGMSVVAGVAFSGGTNMHAALAWKEQSTAASIAPTWATGAGNTGCNTLFSILPLGGGGGGGNIIVVED